MKKIFLLAAILLSTQAQAVRLHCDMEGKTKDHYHFTIDVNDNRLKMAEGYSGIPMLDLGDGVPITSSWESGIIASGRDPDDEGDRINLRLSRHSLRFSIDATYSGADFKRTGQCYESDPKF